jgi:hypothetical protein
LLGVAELASYRLLKVTMRGGVAAMLGWLPGASTAEKKRSAKKRSGNTTPPPRLAAKHFSGEVGPKEVFFEKWEYDTQP